MTDFNALAQMMARNNDIVGNFGQQYIEAQKNALLRQEIMQRLEEQKYDFEEKKSRRGLRNKQAEAEKLKAEISLEFDRPLAEATLKQAQSKAIEAGVDASYAEKYAQLKVREISARINQANAVAAASNRKNTGWSPKDPVGKAVYDYLSAPEEAKPYLLDNLNNLQKLKQGNANKAQIESEVNEDEFLTNRFESIYEIQADFLKVKPGEEGEEGAAQSLEEWKNIVKKTAPLYDNDLEKTARAVSAIYYIDKDDDNKLKKRSENPEELIKSIEKELDRRGIGIK